MALTLVDHRGGLAVIVPVVSGSFAASLWVLVAVAAGLVASTLPLSPARLRSVREALA